jgi:hypothetical protein
MRSSARLLFCAIALACASACVPASAPDTAHHPVSLTGPYSDLPAAPPGTTIEAGAKVTLDARQQEAVVAGVTKWMKDPGSVQFGRMAGARNGTGLITVCGEVRGRNGTGAWVGMEPYVGVLMGTRANLEFVVVGIASTERERAEVSSLCRDTGASLPG